VIRATALRVGVIGLAVVAVAAVVFAVALVIGAFGLTAALWWSLPAGALVLLVVVGASRLLGPGRP